MKQKIAPTSPKNRNRVNKEIEEVYRESLQQNFEHPQKKSFGIGNSIFFLIISIVGGIAGTVFFLSQNDRFVFFNFQSPENTIVIRNGSKAYTEQEQFMQSFVDQVAPSFLRLYDQEIPETATIIQDTLLTQEHFVGYGFLYTSDGLSFTSSEVLQKGKTYTALDADGESQSVTVSFRDEKSSLAFFTFPGQGLQVIDIADATTPIPLENVFIIQKPETQTQYSVDEQTISKHVRDQLLYPDLFILPSETFFSEVYVDAHVEYPKGTPIFRGDGTLLGFFNGNSNKPSIVYLPERRSLLNQYLVDKKIVYPSLSVHGIDLSLIPYVPESFRQGRTNGFLLVDSSDGLVLAVTEGSPAAVAGLLAGDIITQVNGQNISETESIGQALLTVDGQTEIPIKYFRGGKELTVSIANETQIQ